MPNTSITIGIGNPTPGVLYQYEVGLCASGNYPFTQITTQTTLTIDLAEESWYQEGQPYCYRICEVNIDGEVIGCCCEGEGDSPYELIEEDRYVANCCTPSSYYTATIQSYFEISTGTYTVGDGQCYIIGELSTNNPVNEIGPLLSIADCNNLDECDECQYTLFTCGPTNVPSYTVQLSPYQTVNQGENGDIYEYNGQCYYFWHGQNYPTLTTLVIDPADINVNQGCDECQNPSPQITYKIVNCQYPWAVGGNNSSINFVDGYTPQIGVDMVFGNYGSQQTSTAGCWTVTDVQPIYVPSAAQFTQSDIINETNCIDCIDENFTAWDIENCDDPTDTLVIALYSTTPNPTIGNSSTADSILIDGNCYFFSGGPGNINGAETLIDDLTENPITPGGCSSCSGA